MDPHRRRLAGLGPDPPSGFRPAGQPHEPIGLDARPRARDPVHAGVSPLRRALGRPCRQWPGRVASRDLEIGAAGSVRATRRAVSARARHQPRLAGAGSRAGASIPRRGEAQHRRQRGRHPAIRCARRAAARGRGRRPRARDGRHGLGAGVPAYRGRSHHAARDTSCSTPSASRRPRITASIFVRPTSVRWTTYGAARRMPCVAAGPGSLRPPSRSVP